MAKKSSAPVAAAVKARKPNAEESALSPTRQRASSLLDTRLVYCGDNLEQLAKLPDACRKPMQNAIFIIGHLMLGGSHCQTILEYKFHHSFIICHLIVGKLRAMNSFECLPIKV
jgi:hypothetical protein